MKGGKDFRLVMERRAEGDKGAPGESYPALSTAEEEGRDDGPEEHGDEAVRADANVELPPSARCG